MKVYSSECPCYGCTYRKVGCHSNCENPVQTYSSWKESGIEAPRAVPWSPAAYKRRQARAIDREMGRGKVRR